MAISSSVFGPKLLQDRMNLLPCKHSVRCAASKDAKRNLASECVPAALATSVAFALAMKGGGARAVAAEMVKDTAVVNKAMAMAVASSWTGFAAGCLHTLTGVDHLAALAPLCIGRSNRLLESAALGALWGCGHDVGHVLFGILFLLLRDKLKIEVLRVWGSRVVGLTLVAIGAVGIREALADTAAEVDETTAAAAAAAAEVDEATVAAAAANTLEQDGKNKSSLLFTFATGLVYGMQPDALLMVLPALAMPSRLAGLLFLGMFSLGTVVSMSSYTLFLASCSTVLRKRLPKVTRNLSWISSMVAVAFGLAVLCGELLVF